MPRKIDLILVIILILITSTLLYEAMALEFIGILRRQQIALPLVREKSLYRVNIELNDRILVDRALPPSLIVLKVYGSKPRYIKITSCLIGKDFTLQCYINTELLKRITVCTYQPLYLAYRKSIEFICSNTVRESLSRVYGLKSSIVVEYSRYRSIQSIYMPINNELIDAVSSISGIDSSILYIPGSITMKINGSRYAITLMPGSILYIVPDIVDISKVIPVLLSITSTPVILVKQDIHGYIYVVTLYSSLLRSQYVSKNPTVSADIPVDSKIITVRKSIRIEWIAMIFNNISINLYSKPIVKVGTLRIDSIKAKYRCSTVVKYIKMESLKNFILKHICRDLNSRPTLREIVEALQRAYRESFRYGYIDLRDFGSNVIEAFIKSRKGNCVHFSILTTYILNLFGFNAVTTIGLYRIKELGSGYVVYALHSWTELEIKIHRNGAYYIGYIVIDLTPSIDVDLNILQNGFNGDSITSGIYVSITPVTLSNREEHKSLGKILKLDVFSTSIAVTSTAIVLIFMLLTSIPYRIHRLYLKLYAKISRDPKKVIEKLYRYLTIIGLPVKNLTLRELVNTIVRNRRDLLKALEYVRIYEEYRYGVKPVPRDRVLRAVQALIKILYGYIH